jgi:hypothetical protein
LLKSSIVREDILLYFPYVPSISQARRKYKGLRMKESRGK